MKLNCYTLVAPQHTCKIVPAPAKRDWMEAFPDKHAYRCLPLAIANTAGWQLLCPCDIEIKFNGKMGRDDVKVKSTNGFDVRYAAESNFTRGILTFFTNYLFETEPGWQLLATGPFNQPKDGLYPLTGIVETDWLPYPFTMNWQITRPGTYTFKKDEPFCQIMPIPKSYLQTIEPAIHSIDDNHALREEKEAFQDERAAFRARQEAGDYEALQQGWQRFYFQGKMPTGTEAPDDHTNKMRLKAPIDKRGTKVESSK